MENSYWHEKWKNGDTKFNQDCVHPSLPAYFKTIKPGCVFVPLCGKTIDMLWLAERGHKVIGCELSEIPIRDFFEQNKLSYSEVRVTPECGAYTFRVFQSEKITIWCGDFFELPLDLFQTVTGIYDRAAMVALSSDIRSSYAKRICEFARQSQGELAYLLVTFEYDQSRVLGPPFNVSSSEVLQSFKDTFKVKQEDTISTSSLNNNPKFDNVMAIEKVYFMNRL